MLKVDSVNQYYGGSHILRGLSFEAKVGEAQDKKTKEILED